jgi:hypothetical protein
MPPKRRPSLGRSTASAKKVAASRASETLPEREARLEDMRGRAASSRASETLSEREARLEDKRGRAASSRASETLSEREARLSDKRTRATSSRMKIFQKDLKLEAFQYQPSENYHDHNTVQIGKMEVVCSQCQALKWRDETPGMCCSNGKVKLPFSLSPPDPLKTLMAGQTPLSRHFLTNIRKYNSCFQMTSFGATREVYEHGFMPTFKVQGQVYHKIGSLLPVENGDHQFLQIYFLGDSAEEAQKRCSVFPNTRLDIITDLQEMLHSKNPYIQSFKTALENMPSEEYKVVIRADKTPRGEHQRRFNAPTFNEVAIVMSGNEFERRDIVLQKRDSNLQRVVETHRSYDALQYPLIFWQGEDGYHFGIPQTDPKTGNQLLGKKVSAMDFYAYKIMTRAGEENHLLECRQLFHQFIVDMYAKIESERLLFIRLNQKKLRSEEYIHLRDAIGNDANPSDLGKMVILPSSVTGSPRHMHEYTQDAMTYVRSYGRPDLFITFTCNPAWSEINAELLPGQTPVDRHDLLARVFKRKLTKMMDVITKSHIFGETRCWMYSIEWQKRGLPHAHILIWLREKIRPTDIDKVISAELPNPQEDPLLFDIVAKNMIHGPCGNLNKSSPCMVEGKCTKRYPRDLVLETQTGEDGYPVYRRRKPGSGGFTAKIKLHIGSKWQEVEIDNRWIVPYNPLLSKMFQAHINVESCQSVKSIKYICKYVNKGSDQAVFELQKKESILDEVEIFQMGRYISSNEAVWRILGFPIHERHPTVVHLSVHLENGQRVYFDPKTVQPETILSPPKTTLLAFFELSQKDPFAQTLLYCEVPRYFTWDPSKKAFQRRKQGKDVDGHPGVKATDALGRVYTVHPSNAECFYLRMLLHVVRGPTSFLHLKTVGGVLCRTFREACQRRGLLENDGQWNMALEEASATQTPKRIRHLFAILLTTCGISNPLHLWEKYKAVLSEDILHQLRRDNPSIQVELCDRIYNQTLFFLEDLCLSMSGKSLKILGLPSPDRREEQNSLCKEILRETRYNIQALSNFVAQNEQLLVPDQREAYNAILKLIDANQGGIVFLDAPGGTGKTFLINLLLAKVRKQKKIALAVASSGIAATLIEGGRTAHSTFKLPLNLAHGDSPVCDISKGSGQAKVLQFCSAIIWDECTMSHKRALEAVDRLLQDIRGNKLLMGGTVLVLAGDFRQTLPVIPRSTPTDELNACIKASYLWRHVKKMTLKTNMRVHMTHDPSAGVFSAQLLTLGNGKAPAESNTGLISFPKNFCTIVKSTEELKCRVFHNIRLHFRNPQWLCERAILAPKNDMVNKINLQIQELLPGFTQIYRSVDTVMDPAQAVYYPTEFLNSLEPPGIPPHILQLKIGSPIMLLRNLDPPKLCNGTRLLIKNLFPNIIEATILTGCAKGEDVFVPRIPLIPSDLPFDFKRLQFPVRLAYAMSINKAQGQSLKVAGINLETPCFSHGQLYVACSRVGTAKNLFIFAPEGKTKNIVYQKALQ